MLTNEEGINYRYNAMAPSSNFEFLFSAVANGSIPVSKYRSKDTGISVFIGQVEGPLVNGYFCLGKL